ncbi:MAG: DUF1365 family protein [Candidatus Sumerlaeia bacterium]|nr:DUF1365 family protein [Candidatus Sumerlaeia bacterium]
MRSRLYVGEVAHARLDPVRHTFRYPVFCYCFDLDELPELARRIPMFAHNRPGLVSLLERDYLEGGGAPLKERLIALLRRFGLEEDVARVELVTTARLMNYAFNPVSFFYAYGGDGRPVAYLAEVNNTFGERHLYPMVGAGRGAPPGFLGRFTMAKDFHVSPFYERAGDFDFHLAELGDRLDIRVNVLREGKAAFYASLRGKMRPFTTGDLTRTLAAMPFATALTMPRIVWQAAKLYYGKGLPVYPKPSPTSALTVRPEPPSAIQRLGTSLILGQFERMATGRLSVELPDRTQRTFGKGGGLESSMRVSDWNFFSRCLADGDIGFAESYMAGEWSTPDLTATLAFFADNIQNVNEDQPATALLGSLANRAAHLLRRNSRAGSRRNIAAHYDLSNDFFQLFLDPATMMYSSGVYPSPETTHHEAQVAKLDAIISKAYLKPTDHVLEIGCGWGGFAIRAAQTIGCRVTGITLSKEQLAFAKARIAECGLEGRIDLRLIDYRDLEGSFDKVVSIEMIEAVGHENLPAYFAAIDRLMKPDGLAVIQGITMPDQRYARYLRNCDFIQKHIFPGAVCPSITAMVNAMTSASRLIVHRVDDIGVHYARTLREWRDRFLAKRAEVEQLGFDNRFIRMWEYYFCYCEAGFSTRTISNVQLVLTRPNNRALPAS